MIDVKVVTALNQKGIEQTFDDPRGDVGRWLNRKGREIVVAAKRDVGVDSARLRESIHMRHYRGPGGQYVTVGSDNRIAYIHHEGTRPHWITPDPPQTHLRFSTGARIIYTRAVLHPGTRPNRYLTNNLILVRT